MPIPGLQGLWELELASGQLPETSIGLLQYKFPDDPPTHHHLGTTTATTTTITTLCSQFSRFHEAPVVPSCAMAGTPSGRHHKPRRKVKQNGDGKGFQLSKAETLVRAPSFPLSAFLWPARGSVSQWEVLPLILMVVGLFRWAAGLWGYSGEHESRCCGRA